MILISIIEVFVVVSLFRVKQTAVPTITSRGRSSLTTTFTSTDAAETFIIIKHEDDDQRNMSTVIASAFVFFKAPKVCFYCDKLFVTVVDRLHCVICKKWKFRSDARNLPFYVFLFTVFCSVKKSSARRDEKQHDRF